MSELLNNQRNIHIFFSVMDPGVRGPEDSKTTTFLPPAAITTTTSSLVDPAAAAQVVQVAASILQVQGRTKKVEGGGGRLA